MADNQAMEDAIGTAAGMMLLSMIESLKIAGVESQKAVRLATMSMLEGAFGRGVWDVVGVPAVTARRWRREIRELADVIPDEPPAEFVVKVIDLLAEEAKRKARESFGE